MEIVFEVEDDTSELESLVEHFVKDLDPVEGDKLLLFRDDCTGAIYAECHIAADTMLKFSTDDVPLDPEASGEYRANRQLVDDHAAFKQMESDALKGRSTDWELLKAHCIPKLTELPGKLPQATKISSLRRDQIRLVFKFIRAPRLPPDRVRGCAFGLAIWPRLGPAPLARLCACVWGAWAWLPQ